MFTLCISLHNTMKEMQPALLALLLLLFSNGLSMGSAIYDCYIPPELKPKLHADAEAINEASIDFGNYVRITPSFVFYPSAVVDITKLIRSSYNCSRPFLISARGNSHSTAGQATANNGVVIDMRELRKKSLLTGVSVSNDRSYADVGGQMMWIDVMNETLKKGLLPLVFTDYVKLTVGGTLSNAGISGQIFRVGPQISNVLELDVVTGKGELLKCSESNNRELFFSALGGLGQFGVITRARIPLQPAKELALRMLMLYSNFTRFKMDQESIISISGSKTVGYMEGQVFIDNNGWDTTFPESYHPQIRKLLKKYSVLYCLDMMEPYNAMEVQAAQKKMKSIMNMLSPIPGLVIQMDVPYVDFLQRVPDQEHTTLSHPWLDLFVAGSGISEFNTGVFRNIVLSRNITFGRILVYPVNKNKWKPNTSVAIPDEDVFYAVSFLNQCQKSEWQIYINLNNDIRSFCKRKGIQAKRYLPIYSTKNQWMEHFGKKWPTFSKSKEEFDPKHILSSGQRIFN